MGHFRGATTDVQSGAGKFLDAESGKTHASADDVHDGVDRAHFVEMDFFDGDVVNGGFRFAQFSENRGGTVFYRRGQFRFVKNVENCGERAMRVGVLGGDFDVRGGHAIFPNFFGGDLPARDVEALEFSAQEIDGDTRIDQGAEGHVAADAAETIEVGEFHECADLLEKMVQIDSIGEGYGTSNRVKER